MDKQNEQPKQLKAPKPNATQQLFGPAPTPAETPYEKQPVNQQYFAQPQAAPVQYVVMAPSLKGVKGWLAFFMVAFVIDALVSVSMFFGSLLNPSLPSAIVSTVIAPIVTALAITTVVMINMQKKLGKRLAIATLIASFLHTTIITVVSTFSIDSGTAATIGVISTVTIQAIIVGLFCLYFCASKRVKETLVD